MFRPIVFLHISKGVENLNSHPCGRYLTGWHHDSSMLIVLGVNQFASQIGQEHNTGGESQTTSRMRFDTTYGKHHSLVYMQDTDQLLLAFDTRVEVWDIKKGERRLVQRGKLSDFKRLGNAQIGTSTNNQEAEAQFKQAQVGKVDYPVISGLVSSPVQVVPRGCASIELKPPQFVFPTDICCM